MEGNKQLVETCYFKGGMEWKTQCRHQMSVGNNVAEEKWFKSMEDVETID